MVWCTLFITFHVSLSLNNMFSWTSDSSHQYLSDFIPAQSFESSLHPRYALRHLRKGTRAELYGKSRLIHHLETQLWLTDYRAVFLFLVWELLLFPIYHFVNKDVFAAFVLSLYHCPYSSRERKGADVLSQIMAVLGLKLGRTGANRSRFGSNFGLTFAKRSQYKS